MGTLWSHVGGSVTHRERHFALVSFAFFPSARASGMGVVKGRRGSAGIFIAAPARRPHLLLHGLIARMDQEAGVDYGRSDQIQSPEGKFQANRRVQWVFE
ncbi:hypothetical protein ACFPC0_09710 [Streptomyces andamanensis]|uniref:Uncharacterized protein n=1 Tax=Streptomyces andamanensis TaxID=1565035 RepID=A0ABV8TBX9_9ACTN